MRLANLLGVRRGEGRRVALASALFFTFIAGIVAIKAAANALFLSRHDPRLLPALYIGSALFVAGTLARLGPILADPSGRRRRWMLPASLGSVFVLLVGLLAAGVPASPGIYLAGELASTILNIQFWALAGEVFDPRAGRRLFGLLAGLGQIGSLIGGYAVAFLAPEIGAPGLVLAGGVCLASCGLLARRLGRGVGHHLGPGPRTPGEERRTRSPMRFALTRRLVAYTALASTLTVVVDFAFRLDAQSRLDEASMTALFGQLNAQVGLLAALFQVFFARRLLERFGLLRYLMMIPVAVFAAGSAFLAGGAGAALYALKLVENAGSLSINHPALQLLYGALPRQVRTKARSFVDGTVRKGSLAIGGGLLLWIAYAGGADFDASSIVTLALVLVGLQLAVIANLRDPHAAALFEGLRGARRRLDDEGPGPDVALEPVTRDSLLDILARGHDPQAAATAMELLLRDGGTPRDRVLRAALDRSDDALRISAMERLVAPLTPGIAAAMHRLAQSTDPALRVAAITHLRRLGEATPEELALAWELIEEVLDSDSRPSSRRRAAELLGGLDQPEVEGPLRRLLSDPDASVRIAAAQSAAQARCEPLVDDLFAHLADPDVRRAARRALVRFGDVAVPTAEAWLNDYEHPVEVRLMLPRMLRKIGTPAAARALLFSNIDDNALLRHRIIVALSRLRKRRPELRFDEKRAIEAAARRARAYLHYAEIEAEVASGPSELDLVKRALATRLVQNFEGVFRLLGLVRDRRMISVAADGAMDSRSEQQAASLELLETLMPDGLRVVALQMITREQERRSPERSTADPDAWRGRANALLESKDVLLKATVIHAAGRLGDDVELTYPRLRDTVDIQTPELLDRVFHLQRDSLFAGLSVDDLVSVAAIATPRMVDEGAQIFEEGSPPEALYILTLGEVRITRRGKEVALLGPGDSFGGTSMLDGRPRAATATAADDCELLVIDRTDFLDLVSDRVELIQGVFSVMTGRLRDMLDLAADARPVP